MLAVLGTSSADATYFGRVFLIEIFAVSSVVVVVGPKLVRAIQIRRNPELGRKKGRVNVTGIYQPTSSQDTVTSLKISNLSAGTAKPPGLADSGWKSFTSTSPLPNMQPIVHSEAESDVEQAPRAESFVSTLVDI